MELHKHYILLQKPVISCTCLYSKYILLISNRLILSFPCLMFIDLPALKLRNKCKQIRRLILKKTICEIYRNLFFTISTDNLFIQKSLSFSVFMYNCAMNIIEKKPHNNCYIGMLSYLQQLWQMLH